MKQFRSQRWWEKKLETYTTIIELLSLISFYYGSKVAADEEGAEYEVPEEVKNKVWLAQHEIERHAAVGAYLLSDRAVSSLQQYVGSTRFLEPTEVGGLHDLFDTLAFEAKKCIPVLIEQAKAELS
jgi:hypothetical protein